MVGDFNIFLIITGKKNVFKDREDLNTAVAPVTPTPLHPRTAETSSRSKWQGCSNEEGQSQG